MKLQAVLDALCRLAPEHLAEPWDKVGLHLGDAAQRVHRAMLCIDLTEPVVAEAVREKADLVVAYHPPIFQPLDRLTGETCKQRVIQECVRKKIAVYSPHTALDAAKGGVNDWLCEAMGQGTVRPIGIHRPRGEKQFKIVTFLPTSHVQAVRRRLSQAQAGVIGNYVECSFTTPGEGTFRGIEGANPYIGQAGRLESVRELRLEMVCRAGHLPGAIEALRRAHPYEEPAFDLYELTTPPPRFDEATGPGRIIQLKQPVMPQTLVRRLKKHLGVKHLELAVPTHLDRDPDTGRYRGRITTVAVCAGAGGLVVMRDEAGAADAWFTGEMRHHDVLEAVQRGRVVILAGHTQTERPYLPQYRQRIAAAGGAEQVQWLISEADIAPSRMV